MKNWYIRNNEEHLGPYSVEELKLLGLFSNDYVWKEGMPHWAKAGSLEELKDMIITAEHILIPPDATLTADERYAKYLESKMGFRQFISEAVKNLSSVFRKRANTAL